MLKKTITYEDYNGDTQTEDFYFNLTVAEVNDLNLRSPGGYQAMIETLVNNKDGNAIADVIRSFIRNAYGQKSADGRHFYKSEKISDEFESSPAYSILFMELFDGKNMAAFVDAILPKKKQNNESPIPAPTR